MAQRTFAHTTKRIGNANVRTVSTITCVGCRRTDEFVHIGAKPNEAVEQYFRNHGWQVGKTARKDVCPTCQMQARKVKPVTKIEEKAAVIAVEPRQMDRDDRRLIFAKIDEVYEKDGYVAPWTDAAAARSLGVPRAWVSQVRDEMFGPAGSNPELDQYLTQVEELREDIDRTKEEFTRVVTGLVAKQGELEKLARKIEKEIGR